MKRLIALSLLAATIVAPAAPAAASAASSCAPGVRAVSYSDALDKAVRDGVTVGGLSALAWDGRTKSWATVVDNRNAEPSRVWFFRDPAHPRLVGAPLVLRKADGTPYDGVTADNEGLVILPNGDLVVSSETEPAIRIFGRNGVEKASLPVPARFAPAPAGEATANATLEGLTITPDGDRIIAAMEGVLTGETAHRFLVYDRGRHGAWKLTRQILYRADTGLRVPEVAAYGKNSLLVMEAGFTAGVGNTVKLYAVKAPGRDKKLVADLVNCPTLGATAKQPQPNPLLDNYEAMALVPIRHGYRIHLLSDDNFGATQITRLLTLDARL
ncbi:esterase-like activity of phytase family protein [Actinoplanes sp. Pm04-4]|uniref:Esterase-like activity of phytase family protein n=1 Tax=Paractinoplanes pyxinae TaxID=2997416 RepID=A0ABT4B7G0_9ACTN|nr:esterase-like activity of phytase family protein [Actinoplanes pyxinae]MCY1142406.1 esterase-like activity of phytase family protein [Actinoplanes pyxinae]